LTTDSAASERNPTDPVTSQAAVLSPIVVSAAAMESQAKRVRRDALFVVKDRSLRSAKPPAASCRPATFELVVTIYPLCGYVVTTVPTSSTATPPLLPRMLGDTLGRALGRSPVVLLVGARQTGKSTLAGPLNPADPATVVTLDDLGTLAAAQSDPEGFIAGIRGPCVIDEIQRAPDLLPAIKASVDRNRRPGRFLLTGSAQVLLLPRVSESLAGRMEMLTLWPLAQSEIEQTTVNIVDAAFRAEPTLSVGRTEGRDSLMERVLRGGFPEVVARPKPDREPWLRAYVASVVQRDLRDIANVERLAEIPRLLQVLATRATGLLNLADVARAAGIPHTSLQRYLALLENVYLTLRVPAWHADLGRRLVKSPKLLVTDSALLAHLLGVDAARLRDNATHLGPLLENFVGIELMKQAECSDSRPRLFHYRSQSGAEVDYVLETPDGRVVGIEVKSSGTIRSDDTRGLRQLEGDLGDRFARGVILYTGERFVPVSERIAALPVSALWW
jgi:uncharacterized protein